MKYTRNHTKCPSAFKAIGDLYDQHAIGITVQCNELNKIRYVRSQISIQMAAAVAAVTAPVAAAAVAAEIAVTTATAVTAASAAAALPLRKELLRI